jgi:hypothetical protein
MHFHPKTLALFAVVLLASAACGRVPTGPGDVAEVQLTDPVTALTAALAQQGVTAVPKERFPRESHCLSVGALRLAAHDDRRFTRERDRASRDHAANEENLFVFEYKSASAANRDASGVSPDGGSITATDRACAFSWIGPPRFYKSDRLIVLYVGRNENLIRALDDVLGRPFAGR